MSTINERKSNQFVSENDTENIIFVDGAANEKHKKSGIGVVVFKNKEIIHYIAEEIFVSEDRIPTNNESEYLAMIKALEYSKENKLKNVIVYADSKLVVKQVTGEWAIKKDHLIPLYLSARKLFEDQYDNNIKIKHVRREYNYFADFYSKYAIGQVKKNSIDKYKKQYPLEEQENTISNEDKIEKIKNEIENSQNYILKLKEKLNKLI